MSTQADHRGDNVSHLITGKFVAVRVCACVHACVCVCVCVCVLCVCHNVKSVCVRACGFELLAKARISKNVLSKNVLPKNVQPKIFKNMPA